MHYYKTFRTNLYKTPNPSVLKVFIKALNGPFALYIENSTAMPLFKIKLLTYLQAATL